MDLNDLQPAPGSVKVRRRVGRGIGSGFGKTGGRGHKGQKSRSGGFHKVGFEGGQMPIQRRLPKVGFVSRKSLVSQQIRLNDLNAVEGDEVTLETLKAAGVIAKRMKFVKVMLAGEVTRALTIKGIKVTRGAKEAIEKSGGKVE